jgi:hypothetical protein
MYGTIVCAAATATALLQEESINTLRYAQRAMRIENIAVKNEGPTAGPVSYAEVVNLRKEVKALQMALLRAQLNTISSSSSTSGGSSSGGSGGAIMSGDAVTELCALRASTAQLRAQLSAAHSTAAASSERELTVSLRGDRWRQRCTELAAAARQLGGDVPDWAAALLNTTTDYNDNSSSNSDSGGGSAAADDDTSVRGDAAVDADVSLVRAQHARIAALERELAEVKATAAAHAQQLQQHEDDAEYADSADLLLDSSYDAGTAGDSEGRNSVGSSSGGSGRSGGGAEQQKSKEELKRVDAEIQVSTMFTCAAYSLRVLCACSLLCFCTGTTVSDKMLAVGLHYCRGLSRSEAAQRTLSAQSSSRSSSV